MENKIHTRITGNYLDYEGEIVINGDVVGNCSYDKRQNIYIAKHTSAIYKKGFKFLYSGSPKGIAIQIEKRLTKLQTDKA